jgi:hypothetical protein
MRKANKKEEEYLGLSCAVEMCFSIKMVVWQTGESREESPIVKMKTRVCEWKASTQFNHLAKAPRSHG